MTRELLGGLSVQRTGGAWRSGFCYREADGGLVVYERLEDGSEAAEPFTRFKDEADLVSQARAGKLHAVRHWRFVGDEDEISVIDSDTGIIIKPSSLDIAEGRKAGDIDPDWNPSFRTRGAG